MKPRTILILSVTLAAAGAAVGGWLAVSRKLPAPPTVMSTWDPNDPDLGRKAYTMCQACHGITGQGVPGYAPPLAGSPWLSGDLRGAVLITLHGYDATMEPGAAYVSGRMPGHAGQLADHEIAGLLSWARQQWAAASAPVTADLVTALRSRFSDRATPWSPAELRAILKQP